MQRLQEDSRRISNKEAEQGELTSGQAAALLNCEKGMDKLREEVEELEEALQESLRESLASRRAAAKLESRVEHRRKRKAVSDDDSDDEFFDRTIAKSSNGDGQTHEGTEVQTVKTLWERLQGLQEEAAELQRKVSEVRSFGCIQVDVLRGVSCNPRQLAC
jgi:hypothetical protein